MQYARHLALLTLVQQRVVLECTHVAIPFGALGVRLGQDGGALVLQAAADHRAVVRPVGRVGGEGTALARVYVPVEILVDWKCRDWGRQVILFPDNCRLKGVKSVRHLLALQCSSHRHIRTKQKERYKIAVFHFL